MGLDKPNYTQIPNLLLDELMLYMSGSELKVVLAIARQTFGYHRERYPLTITEIEQLTSLSRPAVVEAINTGERRGLIRREQLDNGRFAYSLVINGEVLATGKETLPVKKVNQDDGKESLPHAVKKVNRRSKESLPLSVKKSDRHTPVLKKKESIKEIGGGGDPTNQPINGGAGETPINSPAHHALAVALLVSVGVAMGTARRLADGYAFLEIRRQVAAWLPDHDRGTVGVGALIRRIESAWGCPDLSSEFLRSELYHLHRTTEEIQADDAAEAAAQVRLAEMERARAAKAAAPPSVPAATPAPDTWSQVRAELCAGVGPDVAEQWAAWLEGSDLVAVDSVVGVPLYQVRLTNVEAVGWVTNRMAIAIRRALSSLIGKRVLVDIVHRESSPAFAGQTEPTIMQPQEDHRESVTA